MPRPLKRRQKGLQCATWTGTGLVLLICSLFFLPSVQHQARCLLLKFSSLTLEKNGLRKRQDLDRRSSGWLRVMAMRRGILRPRVAAEMSRTRMTMMMLRKMEDFCRIRGRRKRQRWPLWHEYDNIR